MDRNILDAASGGALVDKTPIAAKALIENKSLNSQQFTTRNNSMVQTKIVNDIQVSSSNKALETRIEELTSLVKQMAVSKPQTTKLYGICTSTEHPTDTCPILQDDSVTQLPQAYANNFFNQSNNQRGFQYSDFADTDWTACHFDECQTVVNPKGSNANVSAISLRSEKVTEPAPRKNQKILEVTLEPSSVVIETEPSVVVETEKEKEKEYVPPVPFPHRILKNKRTGDGDKEKEILDVFRKVAVNIMLLDVIKQVPKNAKFLKDLCTSKKRLKGNERVNLGRNISALIQPKHSLEKATVSSLNQAIPQKCKDPRTFSIPCTIGDTYRFLHSGHVWRNKFKQIAHHFRQAIHENGENKN
ncbi:uncharacterized protein LOC127102545 [Lathyrus oleraceus]|uniref:uncharacterized protein LOC127102545 n=1 Tax=Pisum sativum TaxID=3888 RepID=UPI0021CE46B2|nr:uncharacterized protein LOC127102545 [Pisum sativum]